MVQVGVHLDQNQPVPECDHRPHIHSVPQYALWNWLLASPPPHVIQSPNASTLKVKGNFAFITFYFIIVHFSNISNMDSKLPLLYHECLYQPKVFNRLTPKDPYMGRTAPLTSKRCILYIYSTNISTEYFKHALYSPLFFSSKCSLFHNANLFGSCIIHILYTECAEIKKIIPAPKG